MRRILSFALITGAAAVLAASPLCMATAARAQDVEPTDRDDVPERRDGEPVETVDRIDDGERVEVPERDEPLDRVEQPERDRVEVPEREEPVDRIEPIKDSS